MISIQNIVKIFFFITTLSGCAVGNSVHYSLKAYHKSDLSFIGIPTVLGIGRSGTSFPITPHYSLTTLSTAKSTFSTIYAKHPFCDLAIIKHNNNINDIPIFSSVGVGNKVNNYGYSAFTVLPVSSYGVVKMYTKLKLDNNETRCTLMYSDMGFMSGMSGGPVYRKNNIVGVSINYQIGYFNTKKDIFYGRPGTLFIPFQNFKNWLIDMLSHTEDKKYLKINHIFDFYNNDTGDIKIDHLKNSFFEKSILNDFNN